jgi:hypothetical protein
MSCPRVAKLAVRLGCFVLLPFLVSSTASADGAFVWRNQNADIHEPEQKAVLVFDRGLEDLVLEVRYEGAVRDFGWIVPLPTRPRMRADDPKLFEQLSMATQNAWRPRSERVRGRTATLGTSGGEARVLERVDIGIYDAAVLAAPNGAALQRWLDAHRFHVPSTAFATFDEYAGRGWVFVAFRVAPARVNSATHAALAAGTLQPVRFRFRTDEPVFPLRVSAIGSRPSQVLLYVVASRALVHRTCARADWTENACRPASAWINVDPDTAFPGLANEHGYLTKLRASVSPADMEDVRFRPYDPLTELDSADARRRLEAEAYLGWAKPADAAARLVSALDRAGLSEDERLTVLWSLGEVGGPAAVAALARQARSGSALARIEAIESLSRLRAHEALAVELDLIDAPEPLGWAWDEWQLRETCAGHLVVEGDATCIDRLRGIEARARVVRSRYPPEIAFADRVLAAAAACGDAAAERRIVRSLVASSAITARDVLPERMRAADRGTINGRSNALWPILPLFMPWSSSFGWAELETWNGLLAPRPEVHDRVLRAAAAHMATPDVGYGMLLGLLQHPTAAEDRALLELGRRALGVDSLVVPVRDGSLRSVGNVRFNVPLCVAAYALGRHRAAGPLLELWRASADAEHDVRGEIAVAMALADTDAVLPALEEYVRSDWNARAASAGWVDAVTAAARGRGLSAWDMRAIDVEVRVAPIASELLGPRSTPERMLRLITDPALTPWLRIFWAMRLRAYEARLRPLLPKIRRSLDALAASTKADSVLARGIAGARSNLAIGDKVYAKVVAPGVVAWR